MGSIERSAATAAETTTDRQRGSARPEVSAVIPVHNEGESVVPLLDETVAALRGRFAFEIVVVDDASSDDTAARLAALNQAIPELRVLRHAQRSGQSAALLSGVRAARAVWIATMDGDGQNDPADIPALLALRGRGEEPRLIAGRRRRRHDTGFRRLQSRIANGVRARLLRDATPDTGCGLKLFRREAFLALPHFDHFHRFLPALFIWLGGSVVSVDVNHRPRAAGRSHYGMWGRLAVGLVDLFGVMWLQRRRVVVAAREVSVTRELE